MKIKLDRGAYLPVRAHATDAGLDLRTPYDVKVPAGDGVNIDTGVHIEIPEGFFGKIESKSGLMTRNHLFSPGGVIDHGYTGSIVVRIENLSNRVYWFSAGDKIAQLIVQPYAAPELEVVDELAETERGDHGFGSTGR